MDTIEHSSMTVEQAESLIKRSGGAVYWPETPDEKLDRDWQDFVQFADNIEKGIAKGARLHRHPEQHAQLSRNIERVIRAAKAVGETVDG